MTTRHSNCMRLYVVCLMCTMVFAAGSSFADVTSGSNIPAANVSYTTSDEERSTIAASYVNMPDARVAFTTRKVGVAVIFFQAYIAYDNLPSHPGFQIVVDDQIIFNTDMIGGSIFTSFPGIFSNNWVMPALPPGRHVVQVQWKANRQPVGSPPGDVYALGSSLIVQHGP
jgi:hypothetical protein